MMFFWALAMLGAAFGAIGLAVTLALSNGGPQQAAGAAISLGVAVIPYCLARAIEKMNHAGWPGEVLKLLARADQRGEALGQGLAAMDARIDHRLAAILTNQGPPPVAGPPPLPAPAVKPAEAPGA